MFERLLHCRFHLCPLFMPFIKYNIEHLNDYTGINSNTRAVPVIVSLTSYNDRFKDLPKTLYSLLSQTCKPDRIILWLSDKYNLSNTPYEITRFIKNGLEIRYVKDIGPYTKSFYSFKKFSDSIIVTADDDIYYEPKWLEKLYMSYAAHPEDIHCHRAHRVKLKDGEILSYEKWEKHIKDDTSCFKNFLTGVGGVLYPPNCFTHEILREDIFLKFAPNADDIWMWVMALLHNKKIRVVKNHNKHLICTNIWQQMSNKNLYAVNRNGKNDEQLNKLMVFYKRNLVNKLEREAECG